MGVHERVVVEGSCDICDEIIDVDGSYVNAMVYGVAAHIDCWNGLNPKELTKLLGLDQIHVIRNGEDQGKGSVWR